MKKLFSILWILSILLKLNGQSISETGFPNDSLSRDSQNEIVNTPFGPALRKNGHYIGNKYHLVIKDDRIQKINSSDGKITQEFENAFSSSRIKSSTDFSSPSKVSPAAGFNWENGWITYATCQIMFTNDPISYYSANFVVPSPPVNDSKQLIYLFNGLSTVEYGVGHIVQPVLQWGVSPAGGGPYWSICNWYVNSNDFFYDSLIRVDPGTPLQGIIKLTRVTDTLYSYNSSFKGYSEGFQIDNLPQLMDPCIALEAFNITGCGNYSLDEKLNFSNIQIKIGSLYPPVVWFSNNRVTNCGQFTELVYSSSKNGEINLHFHTPDPINNFTDIHFYPNPIVDFLHISPVGVKENSQDTFRKPITNCTIEIYNLNGRLVNKYFYAKLDQEFNIDFKNTKSGLYVLKFSYNDSVHAFKIIKK